jgi:hypothetical protein
MATLLDLGTQGIVVPFEPVLGAGRMPMRLLYLFPRAVTWMDTVLPTLPSLYGSEIAPIEQLDDFLANYCAGEVLTFRRQFRPIIHIDKGVWELKTVDLRLFGWFHRRDCFVCSAVDDATRVKSVPLYSGYRDQAVHDRESIDLDEPKFVPGEDPNAVLSAFCYPP